MFNLDTGTAIALIAEGSTQRSLIQQYVDNQLMAMTETAIMEFDILPSVS